MMAILFAIAVFPAFIIIGLAAFILYGSFMLVLPFIFKSLLRAAALFGIFRLVTANRMERY